MARRVVTPSGQCIPPPDSGAPDKRSRNLRRVDVPTTLGHAARPGAHPSVTRYCREKLKLTLAYHAAGEVVRQAYERY